MVRLDLTYFISGGFWFLAGQAGSLGLAFVNSLIFARYLPPEVYGTYRYLTSLIMLISLFSLTGLGTSLSQAVAMGKIGTLRIAFKSQLRWSLLLSAVGLGFCLYALLHNNFPYFFVFGIIAITGPLYLSFGLYDSFLSGQGRFREGAIYSLVINTACSLLLLISSFFGQLFLFLFPFQYVIQLLFNFVFYRRVSKKIPENAPDDKNAVGYGKYLSGINILAAVADQADNVILFILAGPTNLAVYSFAIAIPEVIKGLIKTITPLSFPKLAKTESHIFRNSLPIRFAQIFGGTLAIIVIYILAAPFIFNIFFPAYQNAVIYSQLYAFSLLMTPFYLFDAFFKAKKMLRQIFFTYTISPFIQILYMAVFTYFWGLSGLIIARITGRITHLILSLFLVRQNS